LFHVEFSTMDYTLNIVSKCRFFFIFEHPRAPKRPWKIFHGGPGKSCVSFAGAHGPSLSPTFLSLPLDFGSGFVHSDISAHPDFRRRSDGASSLFSMSVDTVTRMSDLEHENDVLRKQLEKIGKMDGFAIERSRRLSTPDEKPAVPRRDRSWSWGRREELKQLRMENKDMIQRLREQADELIELKQERESLLMTIELLQDDLATSEKRRQKTTSPSN